jgi:hypothetical protein
MDASSFRHLAGPHYRWLITSSTNRAGVLVADGPAQLGGTVR